MLDENTIKQLYFKSNQDREDALLAVEVDICQFAENLENYIADEYKMKERTECIKFVRSLNTTVAKALEEWRATNG